MSTRTVPVDTKNKLCEPKQAPFLPEMLYWSHLAEAAHVRRGSLLLSAETAHDVRVSADAAGDTGDHEDHRGILFVNTVLKRRIIVVQ